MIPEWLPSEIQLILFVLAALLFTILTLIVLALVFMWVPLGIYWYFKRQRKASSHLPNLGIWAGKNAELEATLLQLVHQLDQSIDPMFKEQIGQCLQANKKMHPKEFEKRWFEWRRFLILATLVPSIQMYSEEVDEIWHQMLAFTKEYDDFSKRFFGFRFAHQPNLPDQRSATPGEREWFSFLYTLLFKKTNYSVYTWKLGYKKALPYEKLDDFRHLPVDELAKKHFFPLAQQRNPLVDQLTKEMIWQIQDDIQQIDNHVKQHGTSTDQYEKQYENRYTLNEDEKVIATIKNVLFLSLYHAEAFAKYPGWYQEITVNRVSQSEPDDDGDGDGGCSGDGGSCGGGCGGGV